MSDFGTMVTVHRTDGTSTTPSDVAMIRRVAMDLVAPSPDRINEFADFNLRFGGSHKLRGTTGMMIALTEYCLGDDEVLIERDRPFAERFGEQLQEKIGPAFQVEIYCDHW